ncbi:dihydroorotase [Clostridium sp. UBA7503]|uniref:dihydroorotase n=1 Tax=Clostridium sp. UBA7503 TaxID=1946377 RepID=UPI003216C0C4
MEICIKNGTVVDWSGTFIGDVYIKDGIICELGRNLIKDCKTIDATGKIVMPGFVDLHVHFRDPGLTHKEDIQSGSHAAVKGGYVMVNLMANTNPVCSTMETVNYVINRGKEIGLIDINQVISITNEFSGDDISHLDKLKKGDIKVISEDGKDVMHSEVMLNAMIKAKEKDITVMCHCENHNLSDIDMRLAENTMTWRNITLAKYAGCKVHFSHVSTKESMEYIIKAKEKGHKVTCEVSPHHIALTNDVDYRVNPPLREKEDIEYLIQAIKDGYVDSIATDHAPHTEEDKKKGAPGISGIETAFGVAYTKLVKPGYIDLSKLSQIMSKRPSEILGVNRGQIDIGYDGDLVILDLEKEYEIRKEKFLSKGKNTPFDGMKVYGEVISTIKGGKVVYKK